MGSIVLLLLAKDFTYLIDQIVVFRFIALKKLFRKLRVKKVPSIFMRKIVCRLRLNEVSRQ